MLLLFVGVWCCLCWCCWCVGVGWLLLTYLVSSFVCLVVCVCVFGWLVDVDVYDDAGVGVDVDVVVVFGVGGMCF